MISSLMLVAAMWPPFVTDHCPHVENATAVGIARNPHNDFLYCEIFIAENESVIQVNYERNGNIFATKQLDYTYSSQHPTVRQIDSRFGEVSEAIIDKERLILKYKESTHDAVEQVNFLLKNSDVIDAGFNNFIVNHWDELTHGKTVSLHFASIPHQKLLPLRVEMKHHEKCNIPGSHKNINEGYCFLVEIDNALLRLILGNIKLVYDTQHRLEIFNGVVDIDDDERKTQHATIQYYYREDYSPAVANTKHL